MNQYLRDRFEARDAAGIVTAQMDDGRLPLMCESVFESAQFALMLIHQAQQESRRVVRMLRVAGIDFGSQRVLLETRIGTVVFPVDSLPFSVFVPVEGESLHPFLIRAVSALLDSHDTQAVSAAA
jgi:hypothetical protein